MSEKLKGKTAIITGGSRGIGLAIAHRLSASGVNVVIASKTTEPHPKLPGTIHDAANEIKAKGGNVLPLVLDVRSEEQIYGVVRETVNHFGGIDILINNAGAIFLANVENTPVKRYDLMHQINVRGPFLMSQACIPYLKNSEHAHILTLSPPINLSTKWFESHTAYTMSKFGLSMLMFGLAAELRHYSIAVNALWPRTVIATAAVQNLLGGNEMMQKARWPSVVADAAYYVLSQNPADATGQFYIDEDVLRRYGVTDFNQYAVNPSEELAPDIFMEL